MFESDMHAALRLHKKLLYIQHSHVNGLFRGTVDTPQVSLLGGCWLSWASAQPANDWDFFISQNWQSVFEQHGWQFSTLKRRRERFGYHRQKSKENWLISESGKNSAQIILVPEVKDVWQSFDYQHCMLGIEAKYGETSTLVNNAGLTVAYGQLRPNGSEIRSENDIRKKLADKPIFGSGLDAVTKLHQLLVMYCTTLDTEQLTEQ